MRPADCQGPPIVNCRVDVARTKGLEPWEQVLIAIGVMGGLMFITTVVIAAIVVRTALRRRLRAVKIRLRGVQLETNRPNQTFGMSPVLVAGRLGSPGWWALHNRRYRMWRAVTSAENAVSVARRSDVAVGDLPMLSIQLRSAAGAVDAALRASAHSGSIGQEDRRDCQRIEAAAADIYSAAMASLRAASHADAEPLVSAVQIEVAALAAGLRAARG